MKRLLFALALASCNAVTPVECAKLCGDSGVASFDMSACVCKGAPTHSGGTLFDACAAACAPRKVKAAKDAFWSKGTCECEDSK